MASDLIEVESRLWGTADQLRASTGLKPSEFSKPVSAHILLRCADAATCDPSLPKLASGELHVLAVPETQIVAI